MTRGRGSWRSERRVGRIGRLLTVTALLGVIGLLGAIIPAASAAPYGVGDPVSWSNGMVLCQFASSVPSVAVSDVAVHDSGLTLSSVNVSEVGPNQVVEAQTSLARATWNVTNRSTDTAYDLSYSVRAPVVGPTGGPVLGSANLSVSFVLPTYAWSPSVATTTVTVVFVVDSWPWQGAGTHLVLSFGAAPSVAGTERLSASTSPGWLLTSSSNSTGTDREQVGANSSAAVTVAGGTPANVTAESSLTLESPAEAMVAVSFGTSAGAFNSLSFTARVGILLPSSVAGVPLPELAAVGAGAVLVSLGVAAVARRLRRRPSKLIYVSEEEGQ